MTPPDNRYSELLRKLHRDEPLNGGDYRVIAELIEDVLAREEEEEDEQGDAPVKPRPDA